MYVEAGIITRCKKYDKSAFVELFKIYEKYLYKLCYSYVQNEQDALDIAQEVYIKVFNYISRQHEHHDKQNFKDEFRGLLVKNEIEFDEKYVWD